MNLPTLIDQPWVVNAGWSLLHSMWECTLVAILTATILGWMRGRLVASQKYWLLCGALFLMVMLPLGTYIWLPWGDSARLVPSLVTIVGTPAERRVSAEASPQPPLLQQAVGILNHVAPWVFYAWVIGAALSVARLARGWRFARRLTTWRTIEAPAEWKTRFQGLASTLGILRPVQLRGSKVTDAPCLIGFLKPVVLVPAAAFSGMAPARLEAVLAHELAHIRRHDYSISVVQGLAEALLFYHPAVWWASDQVRVAREECCDDIAVATCGSVSTYVLALADLEESRQSALALAASDSGLTARVRRLLGAGEPTRTTAPFAGLLSLIFLLTVAGLTIAQTASPARQGNAHEARENRAGPR